MKLKLIFSILVGSMLTMLSHSFIPHHHHSHSIVSHEDDSCHADAEEHKDDHEIPFHCHAFNDTEWFKQDQDNNSNVIKAVVLAVLNIDFEERKEKSCNFVSRKLPVKQRAYCSYYITRPPPVLS